MGKSYRHISFMVVDKTPIEVVAASPDLFNCRRLDSFSAIRGGFMVNDNNPNNYIFTASDGRFAEFNIIRG